MDETSHSFEEKIQKILPFFIWLLFSAIIWINIVSDYINPESLHTFKNSLYYYTEAHFTLSLFLYAAFALFISTFAWPALFLFALWGGFLFGPLLAILILSPTVALGSSIGFLLAKQALTAVRDMWRPSWLTNFKRHDQPHDFWIILSLRFMPLIPFSTTTLSAALLNLRLKEYISVTLLGTLPSVFFFTYFGSLYSEALENPDQAWGTMCSDPFLLVIFLSFSLGAIFPLIFKWIRNRNGFSNLRS